MKTLKKLMALTLAFAMVMSLSIVAFAAGTNDGSITINEAEVDHTYKIYKVFDLKYSGEGQAVPASGETSSAAYSPVSYSYTKTGDNDQFYTALTGTDSPFTLTATPTTTADNTYVVTLKDGKDVEDIVTFLKSNQNLLTQTGDAVKATSNTVEFENLAHGYYYITSTVGTVVTIDSTIKDVVVKDKNSVPGVDKTITGVSNGGEVLSGGETGAVASSGDAANAKIGDTITYTSTVHAYEGATNLVFHDKMTAGLTLNENSVQVTVNGQPMNTTYYAITASATPATLTAGDVEAGDNITIRFHNSYLNTITDDTDIVITYSAVLNDAAVVTSDGNPNGADLEYGRSPSDTSNPGTNSDGTPDKRTEKDEATVYTYAFALKKVNQAGQPLSDATFQLPFYVKSTPASDGAYIYAGTATGTGLTNTLTTPTNGVLTIKGLQSGESYSITETVAPDGYNKLASAITVTPVVTDRVTTTTETTTYLDKDGNVVSQETTGGSTVTININEAVPVSAFQVIVNKAGAELPSTGGIGTKIFYALGACLVIGAGVVLVSRKRALD